MRIIFVIARFYPFKGGAEQNCWQLATRAAAHGHGVTVLTTDVSPDGSKLLAKETLQGVSIIRTHAWNNQLNLGFYPRLLPEILSLQADVIHVCNGAGFVWRDLCLLIKKVAAPQTKFIITPHGPFLATPATHKGLKYLAARIGKILLQPYLKYVWSKLFNRIIEVNTQQTKWIESDFGFKPEQISYLPNGIDSELILNDFNNKSHKDRLRLAYLGRFEKYKGIQHILKALHIANIDSIKLTLMGRGIYEQDLRKIAHELDLASQVDFVINPSDEFRDEILTNNTDGVLLLSDWEATGIVLLEALAKANFVVTNTNNEASEAIVKPGANGFIVDATQDQAQQLARILVKLSNEHARVIALQKEALDSAYAWSWKAIFPNYLKLLDSLA